MLNTRRLTTIAGAVALAVIPMIGLTTVNEATAAPGCHYKVVWPTAGVYEKPSNLQLLKTKHAGDIVGEFCDWTEWNASEGVHYLAVHTDSAEDGVGWIRWAAVNGV